MRVPQATIIHVEHLPARARQRLRTIAAHRDVLAPTVAVHGSRWGPLAIALGAAVVGVGVLAGAPRGLGLVLGLAAVVAALGTWAAARLILWARLPMPPGCYVFGAYLIDARRPLLVVTPIVRTRPRIERRFGALSLRIGDVVLPLGRMERAQLALTCIHGDLIAYATALACEDASLAGRFDPLAEARDRDGTVIGEPGPARRALAIPWGDAPARARPRCTPRRRVRQ